jgi:hypothetical protein
MVNSVLSSYFDRCKQDFLAVLFLFAFYLVLYRDVVFCPYLVAGVDFQILSYDPITGHLLGFISSWLPQNLGTPAAGVQINWMAALNAFFVFVSGGNQVIAQKFALSSILVASFTMYFFLNKHITKSRLAGFAGAIMYAYSPMTTTNYGTGIVWGIAFLPLVFNYMLNLFKEEVKIRDPILFALSFTLLFSAYPHFLVIIPVVISVLFLVNFITRKSKIGYTLHRLKYCILGFSLFLLMTSSNYLISSVVGYAPSGVVPFSPSGIGYFFSTYSSFTVANAIRLAPQWAVVNPVQQYLQSQPVGFILPMLAFSSLFISRDKQVRKHVIVFSILVISLILFGVSVQQHWGVFIWLYNHFPTLLGPLRDPHAISSLMCFLYSSLITVTVGGLIRLASKLSVAEWRVAHRWIGTGRMFSHVRVRSYLLKGGVLAVLLISYFAYVPAYDPSIHALVPSFKNPLAYESVINWMRDQGADGSFRYLLVPQSHTALINTAHTYPYTFSGYLPQSLSYVLFADGALIQNSTSRLGSLLASANVKYVVVILNSTEADRLGSSVAGDVRSDGGTLLGDPKNFVKAFSIQEDLRPVTYGKGFIIYENMKFIPHIALFPTATYVIGDRNALISMSYLSGFDTRNNIVVFGEQDVDPAESLLNLSSVLVFNERDFNDLLMSFLVNEFGVRLWDYAVSNPEGSSSGWLKSTVTNSCFTYGDGYVETTMDVSMNVKVNCSTDGTYEIWLRLLYSSSSQGTLTFLLDGASLDDMKVRSEAETFIGFKWVNLGSFYLQKGVHTLTVTNQDGYNALDEIIVASPHTIDEVGERILGSIDGHKMLFLYDGSMPFIEREINVPTIQISNSDSLAGWRLLLDWDGKGYDSFEVDTNERKEGVGSIKWTIDMTNDGTSERHILLDIPNELQNWSNQDHLYLWIYGTGTSQPYTIQIRDDAGRWRNLEPPHVTYNGWKQLILPLNEYVEQSATPPDLTRITQVDIGYYPQTGDTGMAILRFDDIGLAKTLEQTFSASVYVPKEDSYSVALTLQSQLNDPLIKLKVDNSTVSIYTGESDWFESQPMFLGTGRHEISITLPNSAKLGKVAIHSGLRLSDLFDNQPSNITYSSKKVSEVEYTVTVQSDKPVFIALGESYHPEWRINLNGKELMHFPAFSLTNGFYIDANGTYTIAIRFEGQEIHIAMTSISVGVLILSVIIVLYDSLRKSEWKPNIKKVRVKTLGK